MGKRKYTLRRRAQLQEETRARIVQATLDLHEEIGPASTTISAIAERAGVERLTVYRHFPDEKSLFLACSSLFIEKTPPPDPRLWKEIDDPRVKTEKALAAIYVYYRTTSGMWSSVLRERHLVPANAEVTADFDRTYLVPIRDDLLRSWGPPSSSRPLLRATLTHLLRFSTWESLSEEGLSERRIAAMGSGWAAMVSGRNERVRA